MTDMPTPDSLRPGHLVGPWHVEGYGGRGTYGAVYRARRAGHPGSLPVALKMALFPDDPRFVREVEILSRIRHPDDLYALGVSLYKLVTGMYPPPGTDPEARESLRRERYPPRLLPEERGVRVLPAVAALVERLMARDPEVRGEAREVAEAAESIVEHAGAEADVPLFGQEPQAPVVVSVPVQWWPRDVPVQEEVRVSDAEPSGHSSMSSPGLAAAAVVLLAVGILWGSRGPREEAPELARAEALADGSAPDAGTRGLGDSTPTTRVASEDLPAVLEAKVVARELPDEPLRGQRRAPCRGHGQIEINGGCWIFIANTQPPCGEDAYEWNGACYSPVFIVERAKPRTSKKPR